MVDLGKLTLLPGIIDLPTHLRAWSGRLDVPFEPEAGYAFSGAANLRRALDSNVITIPRVGSFRDVGLAAKWAVEQVVVPSPWIFACRSFICTTGGHGSEAAVGAH